MTPRPTPAVTPGPVVAPRPAVTPGPAMRPTLCPAATPAPALAAVELMPRPTLLNNEVWAGVRVYRYKHSGATCDELEEFGTKHVWAGVFARVLVFARGVGPGQAEAEARRDLPTFEPEGP